MISPLRWLVHTSYIIIIISNVNLLIFKHLKHHKSFWARLPFFSEFCSLFPWLICDVIPNVCVVLTYNSSGRLPYYFPFYCFSYCCYTLRRKLHSPQWRFLFCLIWYVSLNDKLEVESFVQTLSPPTWH